MWEGVYESQTPLIPSHEPAGTIVAIGSRAQKSGKWKVGARVGAILFRHACRNCSGCFNTSDVRFCQNNDMAGLKNNGGMAEYMIGDADNCVLLPDGVPFEQAAPLMCAGVRLSFPFDSRAMILRLACQTTTWAALMAAGVTGGAPIGIVGIGGLGSLAIQFAKALGHSVVAIDNREEGRKLATEPPLKADLVVDIADSEAISKIKSWAGKDGLAAVIVCTDSVDATEWSLNTLRPHGVAVPVGLPTDAFRFSGFTLIFNELVVKGSLVATRKQAEDMMQVIAHHQIKSHVTTIAMEDVPKVTDMYMDPNLIGRIVMKM